MITTSRGLRGFEYKFRCLKWFFRKLPAKLLDALYKRCCNVASISVELKLSSYLESNQASDDYRFANR